MKRSTALLLLALGASDAAHAGTRRRTEVADVEIMPDDELAADKASNKGGGCKGHLSLTFDDDIAGAGGLGMFSLHYDKNYENAELLSAWRYLGDDRTDEDAFATLLGELQQKTPGAAR